MKSIIVRLIPSSPRLSAIRLWSMENRPGWRAEIALVDDRRVRRRHVTVSGRLTRGARAAFKVVIRTSEIRLSHEPFAAGSHNVLEGQMTNRESRGGLTDHYIQIGSRELVVTSHKLCPMISIDGECGKTFLFIDRSAISIIV